MHFYIDESGNTGNNLFDESQPILYYATLSTPFCLKEDIFLNQEVQKIREKFDVARLHANELGIEKLEQIVPFLESILYKYSIEIKFHFIDKIYYIIIKFFDQVFDAGINLAVPQHWYWTEFRHVLVLKLVELFHVVQEKDKFILNRIWKNILEQNDEKANTELVAICQLLLKYIKLISDGQAKQIITQVLEWTIQNPSEILFNSAGQKNQKGSEQIFITKQVSPNLVGFQLVLLGISETLQTNSAIAESIIVDIQSEFNRSQNILLDWYKKFKNAVIPSEFESIENSPIHTFYRFQEKMNGMPNKELTFQTGDADLGLELVDLYLWIFRRYYENKPLSEKLVKLIELVMQKSSNPCSGISLKITQLRVSMLMQKLD